MESPSATCLAGMTEALHTDFISRDGDKLFPDSEQKWNFSWTTSAKKPPTLSLANRVVEVYGKLLKLHALIPNKVVLFSLVLKTSLLC